MGDYVEDIVCNVSEIQENQIKIVHLGPDETKVLLVKQNGVISALGHKCPHYGAPLEQGVFSNGKIRCQWHGACFNASTGDIEDFPGLDSIPCFQVRIENETIFVRAQIDLLKNQRRIPQKIRTCNKSPVFVVVGGGAAGVTCVNTLRAEGFKGAISFILGEPHLPYDRPKLSKNLNVNLEDIILRNEDYYIDNQIQIIRSHRVVSLNENKKTIQLSNNAEIKYDKLFLASGTSPRRILPKGSDFRNIFALRTFDDAAEISKQVNSETRVVILGSSFIAMEVASFLTGKVETVSIVSRDMVPFASTLGPVVGNRIKTLFEEKGVNYYTGQMIEEYNGENDKLESVRLTNGTLLPADLIIMAVGVVPNTVYLENSSLRLLQNKSVDVNEYLETGCPDIFAGGDMVTAPIFGRKVSIGHWGLAQYHGRIAALNMIAENDKRIPLDTVPFFWTVLFGKSLRFTGFASDVTNILIVGSLAEMKFVVGYIVDGNIGAVLTLGYDPIAAHFAEQLKTGKLLSVSKFTGWVEDKIKN